MLRVALALICVLGCATYGVAGPPAGPSRYYLVGEIQATEVPYVKEYLAENPTTAEIVISSPGGYQLASEEIADAIQRHGNVRCVVRDKAFSGAFAVLQACRVRAMLPGARLGTHEPRMMFPGAVDRVLAVNAFIALEASTLRWNARCAKRLRLTATEYEAKVKGADWFMEAAEALAVGAVDQVADR